MQSTQVNCHVLYEGGFLKHLSSFQMLHDQKPLSRQHGGNHGSHFQATLYWKLPYQALAATAAWLHSCQSKNEAGIPFWQVARGGCSAVRRRSSRKRGEPANRDLPSPFKPASGALVVFLLFCLILSLSSL